MAANLPAAVAAYGPDFSGFWTYWNGLPKHGLVPHLRDYLDNVPPVFQPRVVLLDTSSPTDVYVRLTGTAVANFAGEMTGTHAETLYQGEARKIALESTWAAASRPCGYAVKRDLRNQTGLMFEAQGLILPLKTDTPGSKTVVSFNVLPPQESSAAPGTTGQTVVRYKELIWIDLGAGHPEP